MPDWDAQVSTGLVRSVAVMCRLEADKLSHIRAAVELVRAGRARGHPSQLDVYGDGRFTSLVRRWLRVALPDRGWTMHGAAHAPAEVFKQADVVLGTSRTSIEALAVGRRVVPVRTRRALSGHLGPPVTPETFDAVAAENFGWRSAPALAARQVWDTLETMSPEAVALVCERTRTEFGAEMMLRRELETAERLADRAPPTAQQLRPAERLLAAPFGGARRIPHPLDLPDRVIGRARGDRATTW